MGVTGAVGKEIVKVLYDWQFPIKELKVFASERSAGSKVATPFGELVIGDANRADYTSLDVVFFCG